MDVYGTDQLIPFKPLISLRQWANQIFDDAPTYNHIREYLEDLENNNYEWGNEYGLITDIVKSIKDEIFEREDGHLIRNPDHVHFRELGRIDCLPLLLIPDHDLNIAPIDININTDFIFDILGSYCPDHNSISIDYERLKQYLVIINELNNTDYTEEELLSLIVNHQYGHYLAANTSITFGESDFIHVFNAAFQEIYAQLVCHILVNRIGSKREQKLFKLINDNQSAIYRHFQNDNFRFVRENPEYLPYFLFRARKIYAQSNPLHGQTVRITIEQILDIAPQSKIDIEEAEREILSEIQENLFKAGVFDDKLSRNTGLDSRLFVGFYYCCDHREDAKGGVDPWPH